MAEQGSQLDTATTGEQSAGASSGGDVELQPLRQRHAGPPTLSTGSFPRSSGGGSEDPLSVVVVTGGGADTGSATITTTADTTFTYPPPSAAAPHSLTSGSPQHLGAYNPHSSPFLRGERPGSGGSYQKATYSGSNQLPLTAGDPSDEAAEQRRSPPSESRSSSAPYRMSGKQCVVCCGAVICVIIVACILVGISLRKLEVYEVGLKYHTIRKELEDDPQTEGLHIGEPGFEFVIFPSIFETLDWNDFLCLNKDGVDVVIDMSFQYKVQPRQLLDVVLEFKDYDGYVTMVRNMADTVIHETCSYFETETLQTNRTGFQESMRRLMQQRLGDEIATIITGLQVKNLMRPKDYEQAIRDKESAKEGVQVALNERPRLLTEANTTRLEAITQANITLSKARADARAIQATAGAEAEGIKFAYITEADAYKTIKESLGLDVEGLLSYLSSQLISASNRPIVNIDPPANSQYDRIAGG